MQEFLDILIENHELVAHQTTVYDVCKREIVTTDVPDLGTVSYISEKYNNNISSVSLLPDEHIWVSIPTLGKSESPSTYTYTYLHNNVPRSYVTKSLQYDLVNYMDWKDALKICKTRNYIFMFGFGIDDKLCEQIEEWAADNVSHFNNSLVVGLRTCLDGVTRASCVCHYVARLVSLPVVGITCDKLNKRVYMPEKYANPIHAGAPYKRSYISSAMISIFTNLHQFIDELTPLQINRAAYHDVDFVFSE
jgi:hypothetical protein